MGPEPGSGSSDPDPQIQIHQKNSSKWKMQIIPDPDVVRIWESYQKQCECVRIQIPESEFKNFYANPRFASGPYCTVRTPSSGSNWAANSFYVRVPIIRHLVGAWKYHLLSHLRTMVIPCGSGIPQTTRTIFYYHFTHTLWKGIIPTRPMSLGGPQECLDAWDRFSMPISPRFSDVR